jgi:hypothetical protein
MPGIRTTFTFITTACKALWDILGVAFGTSKKIIPPFSTMTATIGIIRKTFIMIFIKVILRAEYNMPTLFFLSVLKTAIKSPNERTSETACMASSKIRKPIDMAYCGD